MRTCAHSQPNKAYTHTFALRWQGFTLWRLTNHLDRNNAASAQDTANDWEAVAYFGASHQSTATRKERSIEQGTATMFILFHYPWLYTKRHETKTRIRSIKWHTHIRICIHMYFLPVAATVAPSQADALDIQQFNASINQLKAQYDEELARLLSISNSIQESKSTRIDELRAEIADMQQALGIT